MGKRGNSKTGKRRGREASKLVSRELGKLGIHQGSREAGEQGRGGKRKVRKQGTREPGKCGRGKAGKQPGGEV